MPSEIEKKERELHFVRLLNEAEDIGLSDIRPFVGERPDVEAELAGRRIGIEVTEPIEEAYLSTDRRFEDTVLSKVEVFAAAAAPGKAYFETQDLHLEHLKHDGLKDLARRLADVALRLSERSNRVGEHVITATGPFLKAVEKGRRADSARWTICYDVPLPAGFAFVLFVRDDSGPFQALSLGSGRGAFWGPGLDTTAERIAAKAAKLDWQGFDERWLLLPASAAYSRTSVMAARLSNERFPDTGFDRVYMIDGLHPLGTTPTINVVRLDRREI
ncbi:MAG: hypothetical protein ACLPJH_16020 [Myxococcaceae bacterium]